MKKSLNKNFSFLLILSFGIFTKLAGVFLLPIYHDVGWYRALTLFQDGTYMNLIQLEHPPLGYDFYLIALKLFGIQDYVVRTVPFVFSLIELYLIYFLAKKLYDKKTAKVSVILWSVSFFAYVNALSPEVDGSIMGVFSIFLFYFFYEYFNSNKLKYLLLTGAFYGLLILMKLRGILFAIPLVIYCLIKTKNFKKTILTNSFIGLIGVVIFSSFPLAIYLENPAEFTQLIKQIIIHNTTKISFLDSLWQKSIHPLNLLQVLVVVSPLLLFLFWNSLKFKRKNWSDQDILLTVWFVSLAGSLLALLPPGDLAAVYPRYISFLIPPLIILCANSLSKIINSDKKLLFILFSSFVVYFSGYLFNESSLDYWFYSSAAAGVYKIAQPLLLFHIISAFILWSLYWLFKQSKWGIKFLTLFFIVSIAFNFHFILEPIVDQTHPKIINELVEFYNTNNIKQPLFVWAEDLAFYLKSNGLNIKTFTNSHLKNYAKKIGYNEQGHFLFDLNENVSVNQLKQSGGTVFTLYHPYKYAFEKDPGRQKEEKYLENNCKTLKKIIYKTGRGEIWEC